MKHAFALVVVLALAFVLGPTVQAEDDDDRNFVQKALADIRLGEGIHANQVTIFPLVTEAPAPDMAVIPSTKTDKLRISEPEMSRTRYAIEVMNGEAEPVLLLGGTVLEGGERDRLVRRDVLLPPGETILVETMPAASSSDKRKEPIPFQMSPVLAPPFLREHAMFGASSRLIPYFIADYLEFRNEGDERKSLIALNDSSKLTQYCLVCHRTLEAFPQPKEPRQQVVGGVAAVRGRVQSLVIFGDNDLLRAWFEPMLKGHSFAAAAIEIQADKKGVPIPGKDDPDATLAAVAEEAKELLSRLPTAKYVEDDLAEDELGDAFLIKTRDRARGRAVGIDGKLVHLVVFPHDPFERALFKSRLDVPDEDILSDPERAGLTNLQLQRQQGRRLTEAEQRLLDRLRPGAGAGGARPNPNPGTPGGSTPRVPRR